MIICAAIKTGGNLIIRGHRHCDCLITAKRMGIVQKYIVNRTEGFITSKNVFVNRKEGMEIAIKGGQMAKEHRGVELFSEDIY